MEEQLNITPAEVPTMSLSDKIMNVMTAPGALFEYVGRKEPEKSNWSIPLTLSIIFGVLFIFVVFSQTPIQDQLAQKQQQAIEKRVAEGKMTQQQADQAAQFNFAKPGSMMFSIFGSIGVVLATVAALFISAIFYWLILKVGFKSIVPYNKVTEVVGLSMYIGILGSVLTMILIVAMGSMHATPSLGLLVSQFDDQNKVHKILEACNFITIWGTAVTGIGLSKVGRVSLAKGLSAAFGIWILWTIGSIALGSLFGG